MSTVRLWFGSIVFTTYLFVSVAIYGLVVLATAPFPHAVTYRFVMLWVDSVLALLRICCGLDYRVEGLERLPKEPSVLLMKHSSAWETIAQIKIFPPQTWVLKRELLWAPVLGWVLLLLKPIAIDRRGRSAAVQQVLAQGRERLAQGLWVAIFPEGTRVPLGETRRYGLSGALLAAANGRLLVPVAHNAGQFWRRRGFLKRPGTIRVVIGTPVAVGERDPRAVMDEVQAWIEGQVAELTGLPVAVVPKAAARNGGESAVAKS